MTRNINDRDDGTVEYRGFAFPAAEVVPPDHLWYQMDFGGESTWDLRREGMLYAARAVGLGSVKSSVTHSGSVDGILYASAEATVEVDGDEYRAVGGADETSQQVRDPEHTFTVAETRAIKRAIRMAVPVVPADQDRVADDGDIGAGPTPTNKPDDAPDAPPSEWDGPESAPDDGGADGDDLDW